MAINPNNLAGTATLTFSDEFNTQTLDTSTWGTGYPWGAANGSTNTANGESGWYINANYAPTSNLDTYTVHDGVLDIKEAPASAATQSLINGYDVITHPPLRGSDFADSFVGWAEAILSG